MSFKLLLWALVFPWIFLSFDVSPWFITEVVRSRYTSMVAFWREIDVANNPWSFRAVFYPTNVVWTLAATESDLISISFWELSGWFRFHPLLSLTFVFVIFSFCRRPGLLVKILWNVILVVAVYLLILWLLKLSAMFWGRGLVSYCLPHLPESSWHSFNAISFLRSLYRSIRPVTEENLFLHAGQRFHAQLVPPPILVGGNGH